MYGSAQCNVYTDTYIHVHQQLMVVHSVMCIQIHIYMYIGNVW